MIATYQYYAETYGGKRINENDFGQFSMQAQREVEHFTLYRAQEVRMPNFPEKVQNQIRDCICAIAELEYAVEKNEKVAQGIEQGGTIKSRSAGAVSESYEVPKSQYADMSYIEVQQTKAAIMREMLAPCEGTNLISRVIR